MEQKFEYQGRLPKNQAPGNQPITCTIKKIQSKGMEPSYTMTVVLNGQNIVIMDDNYHVLVELLKFFESPTF